VTTQRRAVRSASAEGPIVSNGFVRLDREYILAVRPHLSDRESRVYEAIVLECDGWNRPTNAAELAGITRLHIDHVRKAVRFLEAVGLVQGTWVGNPTSPYAKRSFAIVRAYDGVLGELRAVGRIGPESLGRNSPQTVGQISPESLGRNSPQTVGRIGPPHLRSRSSPDLSRSLPSSPSPSGAPRAPGVASTRATEGTKEGLERSVPDELVELARRLWSTDVTKKAARRYLAPLLRIGKPLATADEVHRFLRSAAKSSRVQRAKFPISAACMPEEFEDWLARARKMRLLVPHRDAAVAARVDALPLAEVANRSRTFARALGSADGAPLPRSTSSASRKES
jgi:hypothetical protein